jgi:hypothetical protein
MGTLTTTRGDCAVFAGAALAFASLATLPLAYVIGQVEFCAGCGTSMFGSFCSGPGYVWCDNDYGLLAASLALVVGGCVAFALPARAVLRWEARTEPRPPVPARGRALIEIGTLATLAAGVELAVAGALTPANLLAVCHEPCSAYVFGGLPESFVLIGSAAAAVGALGLARTIRAARAHPAL